MRRARRSRGTPLGSAPSTGAGPPLPHFMSAPTQEPAAPPTSNPGMSWSNLALYNQQGQPISGSAFDRARISVTNTILGTSATQPLPPTTTTTTTTTTSAVQAQAQAQAQTQFQSPVATPPQAPAHSQASAPLQTQGQAAPPVIAAQFHLPGTLPTHGVTLPSSLLRLGTGEEDGDAEDELLPAMADDDYSAQLSWQSQTKENLKVLMDNVTPIQYERFEAYRRHALPKQAVRKIVLQMLGQQMSQQVAQIVAGFAKVFVGEIVERARVVQARRGDVGPLEPDHLREAYRMYQMETGRVGAAKPLRGKRLFMK